VIAGLAAEAARRGHRVRLHALLEPAPAPGCQAFAGLADAGVEVIEVRLPPRRYRAEARALASVWKSDRPQVVHCHGYHGDLVGWWAASRSGLPLVSTVHGFTGGDLKGRLYESLDRWVLRRFDAVVSVSRPLGAQLEAGGIGAGRVHVVPNALLPVADALPRQGAREVLGLPADQAVVGWIGRLSHEKGPDVMVEALARLPAGTLLSFVGEGALKPVLAERARALGLEARIRWHGAVAGAARLVRAFDLVVLSSRTEGTPMTLLEAMAADVPVGATRVGGVPDVVSPAEALLVPAEDPAALADAIRVALTDADATAERVRAARGRLEDAYGPDAWLASYERIYRGVGCR